jgi:hypothetical protein
MRLLRRIFFCGDVFILPRAHNWLLVAVLQYLPVQKRRYVEFWRGRVSHEPTKIHTSAFCDQIRNNSKKDKMKTSQMMGWIENRPNKFLNQNFVRQGLPAKSKSVRFRFISLTYQHYSKCGALKNQCTNHNKPGRETDSQKSLHCCTHALIY